MICPQCTFLLRRYGHRVTEFLKHAPPEYMTAMGYDKDVVRFSKDCDHWLRLLRKVCNDKDLRTNR